MTAVHRLAACLLACLLATPAVAATDRRNLDTAYGETLYAFYQRQYFDAISRLLVARERDELPTQRDDGELLLGGLYAQYAMPTAAGEVFAQLLPQAQASAQAQRIWLALADLHYRRGRHAEALALIEQHFPRADAPESVVALAVQSLMKLGRYREAAAWLGPKVSDLPEGRYLRFNVAAALINEGEVPAGARMLQELLLAPAPEEEMRALRDRAILALGATLLRTDEPALARTVLAGAQLHGPYSSEALLLYGIAADRAGDPRDALRALLPLATREPQQPAVQEGWIALARAWARSGDERKAFAAYRDALPRLEAALKYVDARQREIADGSWFAVLEQRATELALRDDRGATIGDDLLPGLPLHYRQYASHRFAVTFAQYAEVRRLVRLAEDWQGRAPVLAALAQGRLERHARLAAEADRLLAATALPPLAARHNALVQQVGALLMSDDLRHSAAGGRRLLLASAARVDDTMARWPQHDWSAQQEKLDLLNGVLAWEVAREAPQQQWEWRRGVRETWRLLDDAGKARERVAAALRHEPRHVAGFRQALAADTQELSRLLRQSQALQQGLRAQLEADARETVAFARLRIVSLAAEAYEGMALLGHGAWNEQRRRQGAAGGEAGSDASGSAGATGSRSAE